MAGASLCCCPSPSHLCAAPVPGRGNQTAACTGTFAQSPAALWEASPMSGAATPLQGLCAMGAMSPVHFAQPFATVGPSPTGLQGLRCPHPDSVSHVRRRVSRDHWALAPGLLPGPLVYVFLLHSHWTFQSLNPGTLVCSLYVPSGFRQGLSECSSLGLMSVCLKGWRRTE